jgi:hypothetical protein
LRQLPEKIFVSLDILASFEAELIFLAKGPCEIETCL